MSTFVRVYEYDTRPEGPTTSGPIEHYKHPYVEDATLCEEFLDTQFVEVIAEPTHEIPEPCLVCRSMAPAMVRDMARRQVAQELGVDESEVF